MSANCVIAGGCKLGLGMYLAEGMRKVVYKLSK